MASGFCVDFSAKVIVLLTLVAFCASAESNITHTPSLRCTFHETTADCKGIENFDEIKNGNITQLIVESQELKRITKTDLEKFPKLQSLDFSNSAIEEIEPDAILNLTDLKEINLSGNKNFKPSIKGLVSKSLTYMNLSNIEITEIPATYFNEIPNLTELDLSNASLKEYSALSSLKQLKTLVILDNNNTELLCKGNPIAKIILKQKNGEEKEFLCPVIKSTPEIKEPTKENAKTVSPSVQTSSPEKSSSTVETPPPQSHPEDHQHNTTIESSDKSTITPQQPDSETTQKQENTTIPELKENTTSTLPSKPEVHEPPPKEAEDPNKKQEEVKKPETRNEDSLKKLDKPKAEDSAAGTNLTQTYQVRHEEKSTAIRVLEHPPHEETEGILESTENTPKQSNATNIVIGIILCVMILGSVGFGYKYWKNKRSGYRHANTNENIDEGKELQTIVAHHTDPE